jgi:hypothetical protein
LARIGCAFGRIVWTLRIIIWIFWIIIWVLGRIVWTLQNGTVALE